MKFKMKYIENKWIEILQFYLLNELDSKPRRNRHPGSIDRTIVRLQADSRARSQSIMR